jgi:hypothetical protein
MVASHGDELTDDESLVCEILKDSFTNHMTVADIAYNMGSREYGTNPKVRSILRSLNMKGIPVVTSDEGVCLAEEVSELYAYRENLWQRAEKLITRAHAVGNIARRFEGR